MRKLQKQGIYKALLLAGCAGTFTFAPAAMAQNVDCEANPTDQACVGAEAEAEAASEGSQIIVTGSRIARPDYVNNSPTVSVDEEFLQQSSTAAIEQQLNKLPQFVVSQSSTVKNTEGVLTAAGGDIQPNATNTPGAATVSLRGVGANRSLVLIDGRRGTPSNATGTVDVSTIPNSALQRVEIVSGGASATYGADAVAGVTNFILKDDFQGIELDASMGLSQSGNGFEYQIGGIVGTDFPDGRGNVSLAMSINTREQMYQRDNPFYRDLWDNPNTTSGALFFVPRPGVSGLGLPAACGGASPQPACVLTNMFPGANPPVPNDTDTVYLNEDGSLFLGSASFNGATYAQRGGAAFFQPWPARDAETGAIWRTKSDGRIYAYNALTPQTVPTTRYNFLARGNYEINDWIGVFGQGMFSNSTTYTVQEAGGAQFGWDIMIPWGNDRYTGRIPGFDVVLPAIPPFTSGGSLFNNAPYQNPAVPSSVLVHGDKYNPHFDPFFQTTVYDTYVDPTPNDLSDNLTNPAFREQYGSFLPCANNPTGGCSNTEVFQQVVPDNIEQLLAARTNPNAPFSLAGFLPSPRENYSDVTTYTLVAGLEGSIPGTDWTWEAFVNHGQSRTLSRQTGMYSLQRLRAVFTAPNMGQNFSYTSNQFGGLGGLSPGFGAPTGTCTSGLNFFGGYQDVTQDCLEAIATDNNNSSTARQTIAEVNLQGGLFDLPAGQLRGAVGASYRESRYEFLPDGYATAGRAFLDSIVGIYPGTRMEMSGYDVKEVYGELLVPVLSDIPFIQEFNLELGGRMSDYSTTGTSYTFKILGDWQVTDWLRLRGGFNRAERAPNIAELLLTPQQSFAADPIGDVCSTNSSSSASANPNANASTALDVQAICLELMARDNPTGYVPITNEASFYFAEEADTRQPFGTGGGSAFPVAVGNEYYREHINPDVAPLKPEVADTWTVGAVIQSPVSSGLLSRLNLTVDYFNITINDPIGNSGGGGILLRCVSPLFNPAAEGVAAGATSPDDLDDPAIRARAQAAIAESTCPDVFRTPTNAEANQFGTFDGARVVTTFDNDGQIKLSGIDATMSWSTDLGPGSLFLSLNGNYMIDFKVQPFTGTPMLDYVGTEGTGLKGLNYGSSFKYRIFGTAGYSWGPANLSLQWQHIPATDDAGDVNYHNGLVPEKNSITGLPAYNLFSLNGGYEVNENLRLRFGVDNLFNKKPPLTGVNTDLDLDDDGVDDPGLRPGGGYSFFHDLQGRRFSLGATIRF